MLVTQYEVKFEELANYALRLVEKKDRAQKFEIGLKI